MRGRTHAICSSGDKMESVTLILDPTTFKVVRSRFVPTQKAICIHRSQKMNKVFSFYFCRPPSSIFELKQAVCQETQEELLVGKDDLFRNTSVLKSTLQKSVRRKDAIVALQCTKTLAIVDLQALLRRLVVISAEDVFLDQNAGSTLLFLFLASKFGNTQRYDRCILEWILGYVRSLCEEDAYVDYDQTEDICTTSQTTYQMLIKLYLFNTTLMGGDLRLLTWYHNNYEEGIQVTFATVRSIRWESVDALQTLKITYGIDFHTHPKLLNMVHNRSKEMFEFSKIKQLMWRCRSSLNERKPDVATEEDHNEYQLIKNVVEDVCEIILKRMTR